MKDLDTLKEKAKLYDAIFGSNEGVIIIKGYKEWVKTIHTIFGPQHPDTFSGVFIIRRISLVYAEEVNCKRQTVIEISNEPFININKKFKVIK